ncbi:hypothetical protein L6452_43180 [Arctium lappa]|uniref:Uncharacterized protein n=1 Tax=Arctium lappa TaxID=4217 RepID=A0ACB8XJS3_ARCLA|nr:hypothetical protein L6452_43180 [Arctium lappa]
MYLYERKLGSLKRTVRNKARVEGSIVEAYLVNELSTYCSLYFDPQIETRHNRESRNFAPDIPSSSGIDDRLSIFKVPSRRLFEKGGKKTILTQAEIHKIHTYVLLNCEEVRPFQWTFDEWIRQREPHLDAVARDKARDERFSTWFEQHVMLGSGDFSDHLKSLARGPGRYAWSHKGYFVNSYKFHTVTHAAGRVTHNSGVCVRGSCYDDSEFDYYGLLDDVLEVEYYGVGYCAVVLFKCTWFDSPDGVRVDPKHGLVDIKYKSRLRGEDYYVLASQAEQVYYTPYPSGSKDLKDWWAVVKTKARGIYEVVEMAIDMLDDDNVDGEPFFQTNERVTHHTSNWVNEDLDPVPLVTGELNLVAINDEASEEDASDHEASDEEEEFEDMDDDEDNEDELMLSDHSSDN